MRVLKDIQARPRRGMAILIALAVLAATAMLATVFATMAQMERNVAAAAVDRTRARLLSRAGIEGAVAGLRDLAGKHVFEDPRGMSASPSGSNCRSFQGELSSTYEGGSDTWECEAVDAASGLPLDTDHPFLAAMLDTLGRAIAQLDRGRLDPVRGRGARIVALRDSLGGFRCRQQLLRIFTREELDALAPHVSLGGWRDRTTVSPVPGRQADPIAPFRRDPRPPVDLNTASVPVVCAIISGVDSTLCEPISFDSALRVARELDRVRRSAAPGEGPLESLPRLDRFLKRLTAPPTPWLTPEQAATLIVNFDPNFNPARLNPDRVIARGVDKTRLTFHTFEASFRSMGRYELTSTGRVRGPDGAVVAEVRTVAIAEVYGVLRETLQSEFEDGRHSGPDDGTCTFPEAAGSPPADWSGYIQLHPSPDATSTVPLRFEATFEESFQPRMGTPPLAAPSTAGLLDRGRLHADGLGVRRLDEEPLVFQASPNLPVAEGTIELWFKLNESPTRGAESIWFSSQPVDRGVVLQHRISLRRDKKRLEVRSRRILAEPGAAPGDPPAEVPFEYRDSECAAEIDGPGVANEWHHLSLSWRDATRQRIHLDGREIGSEVRLGAYGGPAPRPMGPADDALWIGVVPESVDGNQGGLLRTGCDATIDDVRVFSLADLRGAGTSPPIDRFSRVSTGPILGRFVGRLDPLPFTALLDTIAWTEWTPSEYEGRPLLDGAVGVRFGLLQPVEAAAPVHWADSCTTCQASGHFGGSHDNATCPVCLGTHEAGLEAEDPPDVGPGEETSFVVEDIVRLGLPRVLVTHEEIQYQMEFVSPEYLTPTNVTPVVDDLTLTYRGPIRFVSWFEE